MLKFIKRTTNHGINALKQNEEDKIHMEEQKKEVQSLKDTVESQKKEIQFLRIVQMEMKTQLAGVMSQVEVLKKDSVLHAASLAASSGRSGRRSYNLPPPLSQQQRASNATEVTIQAQPQTVQLQALQPVAAPASRSYSSGRTASTDSKMSSLLAAVEADQTTTIPHYQTTSPPTATPNPFFAHFQRIPSNDLRTNSFLRTLSGGQFPENWVLPGVTGVQFVEADPTSTTLTANGLSALSAGGIATIAQQVQQQQSTRPDLSQAGNSKDLDRLQLKEHSTFGKSKKKLGPLKDDK